MKKQDQNLKLDKEKGSKRCLRNQWKYVQNYQQSQRVEDAGRQLCQVVVAEISELNKRWNRSNSQGWLNITPHCPPLLELWLEFPQLKSCMPRFKITNYSSSFIDKRLHLAISCWAKVNEEIKVSGSRKEARNKRCLCNQQKYVHFFQQSQRVEDAGRQLCQLVIIEISKGNKRWKRSNSQGWLNLTPHRLPLLERWLQLPRLESRMAKSNKKTIRSRCSWIDQRHLAGPGWAKKTRPKYQARGEREQGREQKMSPQPEKKKYVQKSQQSQGVEDTGQQLCQIVIIDSSESDKRWNRSNSQGWLNLTPYCPPLLELWFHLAALER